MKIGSGMSLEAIVLGLVLLFILNFRPSGIIPERESYALSRKEMEKLAK